MDTKQNLEESWESIIETYVMRFFMFGLFALIVAILK